jgi:hypothetical protein
MAIKKHHAVAVRNNIRRLYGDTSDLSEEVVNTLCNIHYFAQVAQENQDFGGLQDLQEIHPESRRELLMPMYMSHMSHVASAVEFLPDFIKSLRGSRARGAGVYSVMEQLTLDLFKYQIEDAHKKNGLRRSFERKFKKPNEFGGLAKMFELPFREKH